MWSVVWIHVWIKHSSPCDDPQGFYFSSASSPLCNKREVLPIIPWQIIEFKTKVCSFALGLTCNGSSHSTERQTAGPGCAHTGTCSSSPRTETLPESGMSQSEQKKHWVVVNVQAIIIQNCGSTLTSTVPCRESCWNEHHHISVTK